MKITYYNPSFAQARVSVEELRPLLQVFSCSTSKIIFALWSWPWQRILNGVVLALLFGITPAVAQVDGTWKAATASGNWSDSTKWTGDPSPVPGGAGSTVGLNTGTGGSIFVTINGTAGNRTVGTLNFGGTSYWTIQGASSGTLTMDNNGSSAQINVQGNQSTSDVISLPLILNSALIIDSTYANKTLLISGLISGAQSITKNGAGSLTLSGTNTFSGGFTLNGGTLSAGANLAFGNGTLTLNGGTVRNTSSNRNINNTVNLGGNVTIGDSFTTFYFTGNTTLTAASMITVLGSNATRLAGNVGGNFSLTKDGTGTLGLGSLSAGGNNTFTGGFVLNSGSVQLHGLTGVNTQFGTGTLTLNGGSLNSENFVDRTLANAVILGGDVDLNAISGTSNRSITYAGSVTLTGNRTLTTTNTVRAGVISGVINDGGNGYGFTKAGAGQLSLTAANTYSGTTTVGAGTLALGHINALQNSTLDTGASGSQAVTLSVAGTNTYNIGGLQGSDALAMGANTLSVGSKNTNTIFAGDLTGTGLLTKVGTGTLTLSGNNTSTGNITINAGRLQLARQAALYNGTAASWVKTKIYVNSGGTLALNVGGVGEFTAGNVTTLLTNLGTSITNNGLLAGSSLGFDTTNASGGNFTISDVIANSTGTGSGAIGLIKLGSGTLILTGNNTYTGVTTVEAGTVEVRQANALGGTGTGTTVTSGAALALSNGISIGAEALTLAGTGVAGGGALRNLSGNNSYAGTTTLAAASSIQSDADTLTISGAISGAYNLSIGGAGNTTISSNIGTSSLNKNDAGTLTLTGTSSYTGATTILAGTLQIGGSGQLGSGSYAGAIANEGALVFNTAAAQSLSGDITGNGSLTKSNSGTLTLLGTNTFAGGTTISTGTLQIGNAGTSGSLSGNMNISSDGTLTFNRSDIVTVANALVGAGAIRQEGIGTLTLSGTNTNSGNITASAGVLKFDGATSLSSSTALLSASSATISLADGTARTSTLTSGNLSFSSSTFVFDISSTSDSLSLGGVATLSGTNIVQLNFLTPAEAGSWTLISASSGLAGTWSLDTGSFSQPGYSFSLSSNATALTLTALASSSDYYWKGGLSGNWSYTANGTSNWASGIAGNSTLPSMPSAASDVYFSANGATNLTTVLGQDLTINSLTMSDPSGVSIDAGNTLTVNASSASAISITAVSGTTTIQASLAGAGAGLNKTGAGTLILSGSNSYGGATSLQGGTLQIASDAALGSTSGTLTINPGTGNSATLQSGADNITLDVARGIVISSGTARFDTQNYALSINGVISGIGQFEKTGAGTLNLSATNTYTGQTIVTAGTLATTGSHKISDPSTLSVSSGGTFVLGGDDEVASISGAGNFVLNTGTLTSGSANTSTTVSGVISGIGGLQKAGSGTLTLTGANTYSGSTRISSGTLQVTSPAALSSISSLFSGNSVADTSTLEMASAGSYAMDVLSVGGILRFTATGGNSSITFTAPTGSGITGTEASKSLNAGANSSIILGGTFDVVGQSATVNRTLNLEGAGNFAFNGVVQNGIGSNGSVTGAVNKTGSGTLTLAGANTFTGGLSLAAGIVNLNHSNALGTGTFSITGGAFNNTSGGALTIASNNVQAWGGNFTFSGSQDLNMGTGAVTIGANLTTTVAAGNLTVQGQIGGAGSRLTKAGEGRLILSGSNSFSGGITLNAGILDMNNAAALGNGTLILAGGTINNTSGAAITLSTNNLQTWSSNVSFTGTNDLNLGNGSVAMSASRTVTVSSGNLTVGGGISGSGLSLTKAGSGRLILNGANTYNESTLVNAGILETGAADLIHNNSIITVASGATLALGGNETVGNINGAGNYAIGSNTLTTGAMNAPTSVSGVISGIGGSLVKAGIGALTLTGVNTYTGATTITAGTLTIDSAGQLGSGSYSGNIANSGTFNYASSANQTLSGIISGNGGLTKSGNGTLSISGNNSYTGNTTINSGTLAITGSGKLGGGNYTGNIMCSTGGTLLYASSENQTYAWIVSGAGGIFMNGTANNTLSLTGNNTFNGTATINSGTLKAAAANALGSAEQVIVNEGGSLLIAASEAINNGAGVTMNGGEIEFEGNVTEHLGALTLLKDSIIDMAAGNIWLQFSGLSAQMAFDLKIYNYTLYSDYLYFASNTYLQNSLSHIRFYSGTDESSFIGTSFIEGLTPYHVRPVPEPETYATAALLLLGLGIYAYRRRQSATSEVI